MSGGLCFCAGDRSPLDERTYLEPDFIVFERKRPLAELKGPDVLLALEVADSSLRYDLDRKPSIHAGFGVRELWVIDAERRAIHCHAEPSPMGYKRIEERSSADRLTPIYAPEAFAFALDGLEPI